MSDREKKEQEILNQEMSFDEMDTVAGGAGSNNENTEVDGTVVAALGNGMFSVDVGGQTVTAHISGKLRMNFIRIAPGDRVQVEVLGNSGRITYRYR